MNECLSDETFAAWIASELAGDERERAIEHVAGCARCRSLLAHLFATPAAVPQQIGRYVIRGALGAGGMGVVLRGRDETLGRDVAIKMIKAWLVEATHRERMLREAQAMAKISHPNVVTVHELGEAGDEMYVAMELVTGTMLHRWLAAARHARRERLAVALGIGRGIAAVHAADLLHRDIKPDNIIVRDDGTPVLVDFGLARTARTPVLGAGSGFAGTPNYVAPEVAAGQPATAASDQYQWWTIVGELLPGRSRRIARLVARGRDRDPARRFPSMAHAIAALEAAAQPHRAAWIVLGAAIAVASAAYLVLRPTAPSCALGAPAEWSPARRTAIEQHLRSAGVTPDRVLAALDERAQITSELRQRACEADGGDRAEAAQRAACVDKAWARTKEALAKLDQPGGETVREGVEDLVAILPADRCRRGSLPAVPERLPLASQARYDALANAVQGIEAPANGTARDRLARLRGLAPAIARLQYPPLDGRWHWGIAHVLNDMGKHDAAVTEFELAAQAGLAAGDDDLYVRALIGELYDMSTGATPERLAQLEANATAGAQRLGNPQVDAQLLLARANLQMERGDAAKARPLFEQADAVYQRISLAAMTMHMEVDQNLGALCLEQGDFAAADRYLDRAVVLARERFTPQGQYYWEARGARATSYLFRKDYVRAEPELRAAADGLERVAPHADNIGLMRTYLCAVLLAQQKLDDARAQCASAVAADEVRLGPTSPDIAFPLMLGGQVELHAQRADAALALLGRAVALADAGHVRPILATSARAYYAVALVMAHRKAEALPLARQIAPALAGPELSEARGDFQIAFPELGDGGTKRNFDRADRRNR